LILVRTGSKPGKTAGQLFAAEIFFQVAVSLNFLIRFSCPRLVNKELNVEIEKKLNELGFELPNPPVPAANYIGYVRVGNLLYIGGNIGRINGNLRHRGKVGDKVTLEQAYEVARDCALNHLAIMKAALGDLDRVERIVKVLGYVNVAPGFTDMPKVVNGESDLLVQVFGERGQHTRAAVGVASLSQDSPVETEVTVQVKD
jgi:enamine deaminase RidA (YjgF/YER057c/UK114 family)